MNEVKMCSTKKITHIITMHMIPLLYPKPKIQSHFVYIL